VIVGHATFCVVVYNNVVAVLVVLISIVPVYLAHRLTREEGVP
jgi:hypothetical protein